MKELIGLKYRTRAKSELFKLIEKGESIDLIIVFELELSLLRLKNNKYAIARYIYIRLGELFQYDNHLKYASSDKREQIRNRRVDIRNVTNFNIVCDSYSHMYVELLNHFGIEANIVDTKEHVYVTYIIDGKTYLADLTTGNVDITRIKFGLKPIYNRQILPVAPKIDHTFDEIDEYIYKNDISSEKALAYIKQELIFRKSKYKWNKGDYIYQVYKVIESIMNFRRPHIGFISGVTHIYYLLNFFIEDCKIYNTHFLNRDNGLEKEIFMIKNKKERYFVYQEVEKGFFEFHEISKIEIQEYLVDKEFGTIINKDNLLLKK